LTLQDTSTQASTIGGKGSPLKHHP
jgi:hypothetical protein